jgi:hypothetical protein
MAINVFVLTEDLARLVTIESDVNTLRASLTPPLAALTSDEIKLGTIQVGLNAIMAKIDVPNTLPVYPLLSIVGLPGANVSLTPDADLQFYITTVAIAFSESEANVASLALHAGVLMMLGITTNAYRASFV